MKPVILVFAMILMLSITSIQTNAHCDGIDGPVVIDAMKALETENVNLVLIWVMEEYEDEIKDAFNKTLQVRKQSPEAKEMADMYFFETLVRLHRQGEGAPYTGLKPAGRNLGPALQLADASIEKESLKELYELLTNSIHDGLHHYFEMIMYKKNYEINNVQAGREFVEGYVQFVHYVEAIYNMSNIYEENNNHKFENHETHKH